jgi:hypothetical protein
MHDVLDRYLARRPFVPFRIEKTGGVWYEVGNPEMASVTNRVIELGLPIENNTQRFVTIALVHVVSRNRCAGSRRLIGFHAARKPP